MLSACATFVDTRVEDTIRAELPRLVGPADRYDVDVSGAKVSGKSPALLRAAIEGTGKYNEPGMTLIAAPGSAAETLPTLKTHLQLALELQRKWPKHRG